jgi:transposase InsO family protein
MIVTLQTQAIQTLDQVRAFVAGTAPVSFTLADRLSAHAWMADTLKRFSYAHASRADRGVLRRYLEKVTGQSRAQITRRITQFLALGRCDDRRGSPVAPFARRYTADDIRLLAEIDALHGTLSGSTTRKLCERAFTLHGDTRYERLATISNGHLYNLRGHKTYRSMRGSFDKTRPVKNAIGERRKPVPHGQPGYLRVDSVHQGDLDGIKGVYLVNAVDEVTQCQCVCAVERISEAYLLPVLAAMMTAFPFVIRGFHSDNGSEYVNHKMAKLLDKLRIEQTKSRSLQTTDNALAESKNASTVRKHLGYSHIPQRLAGAVNAFTAGVLSPYLNFHRPCHFPAEFTDPKGKIRKRYRYADMMTPYEKLKSLPDAARYLKLEITFKKLDEVASECSDNEAAKRLNLAKAKLFQLINKSQQRAA